jgi:hypothetical protein
VTLLSAKVGVISSLGFLTSCPIALWIITFTILPIQDTAN